MVIEVSDNVMDTSLTVRSDGSAVLTTKGGQVDVDLLSLYRLSHAAHEARKTIDNNIGRK